MKPHTRPKRYGRPCMTDLPPDLGRSIIETIINTPPPDRTIMEREAARAERRLAKIAAEIKRNSKPKSTGVSKRHSEAKRNAVATK